MLFTLLPLRDHFLKLMGQTSFFAILRVLRERDVEC